MENMKTISNRAVRRRLRSEAVSHRTVTVLNTFSINTLHGNSVVYSGLSTLICWCQRLYQQVVFRILFFLLICLSTYNLLAIEMEQLVNVLKEMPWVEKPSTDDTLAQWWPTGGPRVGSGPPSHFEWPP